MKWIAAILVCLPLVACDDSAPEKAAGTKTATTAAKKNTVAENMVAAVSAGKSSTVVGVYFTLGNAPAIDTALPIDVVVLPHQDFTSLQGKFFTQGDGLALMSGDSLPATANVKAETAFQHKLVLMPKKEGVYMISVSVETEGGEGSVSRIFSIPVIVAPPAGAATPPAPATQPAPATN